MFDTVQPALPFADPLPATLAPRSTKRKPSPFPILDAPASPAQMRAMRQAFMGLVKRWALSGDAAAREARLSALLGANRSLLLLLPDPDSCLCFLRRPCRDFAGASVLQVMLANGLSGIERVREHLANLAAGPGMLENR